MAKRTIKAPTEPSKYKILDDRIAPGFKVPYPFTSMKPHYHSFKAPASELKLIRRDFARVKKEDDTMKDKSLVVLKSKRQVRVWLKSDPIMV